MSTFNFTNSQVASLSLLGKITSATYDKDDNNELKVFLGGEVNCDSSLVYNINSIRVECGDINESKSIDKREVLVYKGEKKIASFSLYRQLLGSEGWSTWSVYNRSVMLFCDGIEVNMEYMGGGKFIGTL
jgi:hypothetical protein